MIEPLLVQASSFAPDIDGLILLIAVLVGFWFIVVQSVFFGLLIKFRARPGQRALYITGEEKSQKRWVSIPHALVLICDVFVIVGAVRVWVNVKQDLPPADRTIRIAAQQWAWAFTDPGPDGKLDTADDVKTVNDLHVEIGKTYHFKLLSKDVVHSFSVPVFRLKQDAIPGRTITGWFKPTKTGEHDIQCAEMCGIGHGLMPGKIFIESPAAHAAWLGEHAAVSVAGVKRAKGDAS